MNKSDEYKYYSDSICVYNIGDDEVITCRPADLIGPELEKYKAEMKEKGIGKSEEDVLSYALFPQVAEKFFAVRDGEKGQPVTDNNDVRELIVENLAN